MTPVQTDNRLAVPVILVTVLALSFGDPLLKHISAELVLWQIFVLRSALALPVLIVILRMRYAAESLVPRVPVWTAVRSLMLVAMWIAYYAALPHVSLSVAAATYYTLPIFITLFSAVFVGERVKPVGWMAVVLGFVGVLLILKPVAAAFNHYALLPLVSAVLFALAMILTRTKCRNEHPLVLSGALNVAFILVGVVATLVLRGGESGSDAMAFLSPTWASVSRTELLAIAVLAVTILVGSVGAAIAYQLGASSVVATFDFAYVGFATVWGMVFFSEFPDALAVGGMVLIVVAGVAAVRQGS